MIINITTSDNNECDNEIVWYDPVSNRLLITIEDCLGQFVVDDGKRVSRRIDHCPCCYAEEQNWVLIDLGLNSDYFEV